jgi:hypothetical protein
MVPTEAVHVTPAFNVASPVTVAAKVWVAPATMATGVVVMETLIGVKVTVAVAVLVVSVLLVAVMVAAVVGTGFGAV